MMEDGVAMCSACSLWHGDVNATHCAAHACDGHACSGAVDANMDADELGDDYSG